MPGLPARAAQAEEAALGAMTPLGAIEHWVPRSAWDARAPRCTEPLPIESIERIFVHYTAAEADRQADHDACAARWRAVQAFHLDTRKWCDVAYTIGACRHGFAFEGRPIGRKTAATGPCNFDSYAIVFMGADKATRDDVGSAGREVIAECVAEIELRRGKRLAVKGHRDCMATSCPGDELYGWIRSSAFRRLVEAQKAGGELVWVWQVRAGLKTLYQQRARGGDVNGLERTLAWMARHQPAVRDAERAHGAVKLRKLRVPIVT